MSKAFGIFLSAALVFTAGAAAQSAKKKSSPPKKAASAKPAGQKKGPVSKSSKKATSKTSSKTKKRPPVARRSTQTQPTPDRYRDIQQALAERGYFKGEIDGKWGEDSTDALRRFQRDQSLKEDGKLGALSIIALGLGPKRAAPGVPGERDQP